MDKNTKTPTSESLSAHGTRLPQYNTKPEQKSSWEEEFDEKFPRDHDCFVAGVTGIKKFIRVLLAQAKEEGYYEGEKNEFHNNNFNVSKTIKHIIERAKKEERNRIAEIVRGRLPDPMNESEKEKYHCEASVLFWGEALLAAIAPEVSRDEQ